MVHILVQTPAITVTDYLRLERPHLEFVVDHLIPRDSIVLLAGAPFAGKSYLALQIALAVAQQRHFQGAGVKGGPVLYFEFDEGELVFRHKLGKLAQAGERLDGPVFLLHPGTIITIRDLGHPHFYGLLEDMIKEVDPVLICFDVLREIHSRKENSSDAMKVLFEILEKLVAGRGCLLLHHAKKLDEFSASGDIVDRVRGSSYIAGRVDSLWLLDNQHLTIKSRWCEVLNSDGTRLPSGFWAFPGLLPASLIPHLPASVPLRSQSQIDHQRPTTGDGISA